MKLKNDNDSHTSSFSRSSWHPPETRASYLPRASRPSVSSWIRRTPGYCWADGRIAFWSRRGRWARGSCRRCPPRPTGSWARRCCSRRPMDQAWSSCGTAATTCSAATSRRSDRSRARPTCRRTRRRSRHGQGLPLCWRWTCSGEQFRWDWEG